jgi:hypothetical protein
MIPPFMIVPVATRLAICILVCLSFMGLRFAYLYLGCEWDLQRARTEDPWLNVLEFVLVSLTIVLVGLGYLYFVEGVEGFR